MSILKLTKKDIIKNGDAGSDKITIRKDQISYDSAMVYDWESSAKSSYDAISNYYNRIKNGEYLSQDDLAQFNSAVTSYTENASRLRDLSKRFGEGYTEEDEKSWLDSIESLRTDYDSLSKYYSQFDSEDAYKSALKSAEEYQAMSTDDLEKVRSEITDLKATQYIANKLSEYNKYKAEYELAVKRGDQATARKHSETMTALLEEIKAEDASRGDNRMLFLDDVDISSMTPAERKEYYDSMLSALSSYSDTDLDALESAISSKTAYYNRAKYIQDGIALEGVADKDSEFYDPNFDFLRGYQEGMKTTDKFLWWDIETEDTLYKYINDEQYRMQSGAQAMRGGGLGEYERKNYGHMTEDEIAIFNYYYAKGDKESAQKYLDSIQERLNQRVANKAFENFEDKPFAEMLFGIYAGFDQFSSGMESFGDMLFNGDKEYIPTSTAQMTSQLIRNDLGDSDFKIFGSTLGQIGYDAITTTTNMLPSILVGATINPVLGTSLLGASAAGHGYAEMLNLGYSRGQAQTYGVLVGASETLLQSLLGGISALGGKISGNAIANLVSKFDNAIARVAIQVGGNMASEGLEEGLQTVLEPMFKELVTGEDFENASWNDVLYSALLGALSAGFLEGGSTVVGEVSANRQAKAKYGEQAPSIIADATELGGDAQAYAEKLQGKLDKGKGLSGYDLRRLVEETDSAKIKTEVKDRLTELGETGDVDRIAEILTKKAKGEKLTLTERNALSESQTAQRVANEMDVDNIISGEYASAWAETIGTREINKTAYNFAPYRELRDMVQQASEDGANPNGAVEEASAEGKYTFESEQPTEGEIEASEWGKVIVQDNESEEGGSKKVGIKEIASISNGTMNLRLEDGSIVKASDVEFTSDEEGFLYEVALKEGMNAATANAFVNGYDAFDGGVAVYANGFLEAYKYGTYAFPVSEMSKKGFSSKLSETTRNFAYNLGKTDGKYSVEEQQKFRDQMKAKSEGTAKKGRLIYDGDTESVAKTDRQKASLTALEKIAEALGVDIHIFESKVGENGKRIGENGWFDTKDNSIHIDLYAGLNGEGTMLFTAAHELTHFIRVWSPAKFKVFADFLLEQYGKNGVSVETLVQRQIEKARNSKTHPRELTFDEAYEEVIADSCEAMLADGDALQKIAKLKAKDKSLWKKIKDFIADLVAKIKAVYKGLKPDSVEARYVAEMLDAAEQLKALWTDALVDAGVAYSTAEKTLSENGIAVDQSTESASLFSVRDVLDETTRNKVAKALAVRFDVTEQEAMSWIDAETSLASIILNPKYSRFLDYTADPDEVAIKTNSDYPQGTVDFSNICKKRRDFTEIMNRILRTFPNHVFDATDLAKIRTIMEEEGMEVACGICYVEDRRQLDSVVGQFFIDSLALYRQGSTTRPDGEPFNANQLKALKLIDGDSYTPSIYELITLEGRNGLKAKNPAMEEAWVKFNNARGMQSVRLLLNDAEYTRQILKYGKKTVDKKNSLGGLRIYSFSDMEMFHLIDIIQVITDSAAVGLAIQGYTKVNEYAMAVKDTGLKLNRSLIPLGDLGYHMENGKAVLDFDTVEGIDINHPDFFDSTENPNVGNILIGINETQIRAAMLSEFVDYIIPFHTGQSEDVLSEKGIAEWKNYKDSQSERDISTGKKSSHQINIYTEVIEVAEKEGHPITNKVEFVTKFLEVCKANNLIPRFAEFLNIDENGDYVYTEGYHKFLLDFKMFHPKTGEYLPQMPVKPIFDSEYLTRIMREYAEQQGVKDAEFEKASPRVLERITEEIVQPKSDRKLSDRDFPANAEEVAKEHFGTTEKWSETAWLLRDGDQINFSNHDGKRSKEHYEIVEAFPSLRKFSSMEDREGNVDGFMDRGNIRIVGDGSISLLKMPTEEQFERLHSYFRSHINDYAVVSIGRDALQYGRGTDPSIIVEGIRDHFSRGRRHQSDLMRFHTMYSDRDSTGRTLTAEQQEFFKDSKVRDSEGRLIAVFHGTETGGFTIFDKSHSGDAYWFADRHTAESYIDTSALGEKHWSGEGATTLYGVYLNATNPLVIDADGYRAVTIPTDIFPEDNGRKRFHHIDDIAFYAKDNGYDGLIVNNVKDYGAYTEESLGAESDHDLPTGSVYAVFDSNQIKSTSNKTPTSNPDIRYSDRDYEESLSSVRAELEDVSAKEREAKERLDAFDVVERQNALVEALTKDGLSEEEQARILAEYSKWQEQSGYSEAYSAYDELSKKASELRAEQWRIEKKLTEMLRSREYTDEEVQKYVSKAVRKFRTTSRLKCASYLLTTGSMLDFSEGMGYRVKDHREIAEILDLPEYAEHSDGMIAFMNMGNIRLQTYGIDVSKMPNSKQISSLRGIISEIMRETDGFTVDFSRADGNTVGSVEYPKGVSSSKIISDIKDYFETGKVPEYGSSLSQFRYSDRDSATEAKGFSDYIEGVYNQRGKWYPSDVLDYIKDHPSLNFLQRIYDGDKTAKADLVRFLEGVTDLYVLSNLRWFIPQAYWQDQYRGAKRTFTNAIDRRVSDVKAGMVGGENLGIKNHEATLDEIEALFAKLNSDAEIATLAEKVFATARKLGVNIRFANAPFTKKSVEGHNFGDIVEYRTNFFNDATKTNQRKASVIIHELIHACTIYATRGVENGDIRNFDIVRAVNKLNVIYLEVSKDGELSGEYGMKSVHEFVAELSNPRFTAKLKKKNLLQKIVAWIAEFFGFSKGNTAYDNAMMCLEYLLDNPDIDAYHDRAITMRKAWRERGGEVFGRTVTTDGTVHYSDRDPDSMSNRTLLATALESAAQNDIERSRLVEYKANIARIEELQAKLAELNAEIYRLSFAKGKRDQAEISRLRAEATKIANRINTYDRKLLRLEAAKPLQDVLEREKQRAYRKAEQKGRDAVKAQREKDAERMRDMMLHYQESRRQGVEGRRKTEMRHKIKKVVSDLNKLLLNPDKDHHVPIGLQKPVAEALDIINMDTVGAAERVARYNELIAKAKDPDIIESLKMSRDRIELQGETLAEKLTALKNAYAEFTQSDDPLIRNAHNDAIEELIKNTADMIGNTAIKEMSLSQLEAVYDMYRAVLATVRNANKLFKEGRQETITETSEKVKTEVKEVGGHKDRVLKLTKLLKRFGWAMLKPIYAMKVIGSDTFARLFDNVRAGEDTWAVDVSEARDFYRGLARKYGYNKWDFKKQYTFKDTTGTEFSLSLGQIMSLYAYSKREQADRHLEVGGFIFDEAIEVTEKNKYGIPLTYEVNDANPYRLDQLRLLEVVGALTTEQIGFIDEMQEYLSDTMGAKGNEVSLALYDIKLYKEKHYFPLKTARYFREFNAEQAANPNLKNSGFSRKTVPQAGNPIVLSDFMDVWANHVNDMSMYHAFVLPIEDFMRVYNYSSVAGGYDSVQQYIANAYGSQANQYIEQLMKDLNGGARIDPSAGFINKGISLFKKGAVFASASVVIQQPSAMARAFAYIDPKYFATSTGEALKFGQHKAIWDEVKRYAPVAIIKEMGYFDTHVGRRTTDWIMEQEYDGIREKAKAVFTDEGYRDELLSKAPSMADELTWAYIWLAVKKEIQATTNLKVGSDEFLKRAGERFTEVITNTQVYDSVLSRSSLMRSKDTGVNMATAFMAEPTTSVNMMVDAIIQGKRGNKKFARATVGAVAASVILNSILVSLVYAGRDDDEDKTYWEKYLGRLTSELLDGFNPLTYIPLVKDVWSIAQGFDVERSDMSVISDLWESIEGLFKEDSSGWEKVSDFAGSVATLFGLPLKNILRDAEGLYNLVKTALSGMETTGGGISDSIKDAFYSSIPLWDRLAGSRNKGDKLYDAMISGDQTYIERLKATYDDDSEFKAAVRKALRENDPRIRQAAEAVLKGNQAERIRITREILAEGHFSQDIIVSAINAEVNALKKESN